MSSRFQIFTNRFSLGEGMLYKLRRTFSKDEPKSKIRKNFFFKLTQLAIRSCTFDQPLKPLFSLGFCKIFADGKKN
jgi:hypothetical protein